MRKALIYTSIVLSWLNTTAAYASEWEDWISQPVMIGTWGGARTHMLERGFIFRGAYISETAWNPTGGNAPGSVRYAQAVRFGFDIDMNKAVGFAGNQFHFTLEDRVGRSLTADKIGNRFAVQEIYGFGQNFRLAEMSFEQDLFSRRVNVKVGFYSPGNEFGVSPYYCYFQSVSFCGHVPNLAASSGWTNYPSGRWGGRGKFWLIDQFFYLTTGVFQVNPTYNQKNNGFKMDWSGTTGALVPVELGIQTGREKNGLPGNFKIGGYYDTSPATDQSNPTIIHQGGRYGGYISADQLIYRPPNGIGGLTAFVQYGMSDQTTAPMPTALQIGLVYEGLIPTRPKDVLVFGVTRGETNKYKRQAATTRFFTPPSAEAVFELNYGLQATPWCIVRPNIQFVRSPGAFSFKQVPDVWVVGLQLRLTL